MPLKLRYINGRATWSGSEEGHHEAKVSSEHVHHHRVSCVCGLWVVVVVVFAVIVVVVIVIGVIVIVSVTAQEALLSVAWVATMRDKMSPKLFSFGLFL